MVKTILKLLLSIGIYSLVFVLANAILPFSQGFRELGSSENPLSFLFLLIISAWTCFTIYFIIKNTQLTGNKLFLNTLFIMFFVQYFMTQIETLFFNTAFQVLTRLDVLYIMLAGLFPLLATIPLLIKFFQSKKSALEVKAINPKTTTLKLGIIGILYLCVYMLFGYFVAWQFEELRIFYSGSPEKLSFFGQLLNNIKTNPVIYPFQIIRGILFGTAIVILRNLLPNNKKVFIIAVCLVYLCTAIQLIVPNPLFPDKVRIAHLLEMASSMLLFGIIAGEILWEKGKAGT
ncbi:MAG: hypothetical protein LBN21_09375 [Treponema sp.]|jgi:hypothetical protein|nr:hypothetical protein [Treponema sp.]